MSVISGKGLWSIICGQCVLASDEVVGEELQEAVKHLQEGISFYKSWNEASHNNWVSKTKLKKKQQDFVQKIGRMIDVDSGHAWEIFQLFLQYDYKGSVSQLLTTSSNDREENLFMYKIFTFYIADSLHLLSCRKHILMTDSSHPYQELFKEFVKEVLNKDNELGCKLITQLKLMNNIDLSQKALGSTELNFPHNPLNNWASHYIAAIKHQLATLLIFHGSPNTPCPEESLVQLLQLAQGSGIGRKYLENLSQSEKISFSSQMEAIDAFHSFLLTLAINADSDPSTNPLCSEKWIKRINPLIFSLGSKPWHHPPILAWAILQGRRISGESGASNAEEAAKYSKLAQRAIKGNAFQYLQTALKISAFQTDNLLLRLGASVVYSLLCIVGMCLDFEKLDLTLQSINLAKLCLKFNPPSQLFWNEDGGGASVLLPSALQLFPHDHNRLLDLSTSLALADEFSADKVILLLKDLECLTWPLGGINPHLVSVSGNQCICRESFQPFPGIIVPKGSHGIVLNASMAALDVPLVVSWQIPVNGWQVLLCFQDALLQQIDSGSSVENWHLDLVISSLRVINAILKSSPRQLPMFIHMQQNAQRLLISVCQVSKPHYPLISSLVEFFAEVSKIDCKSVWDALEGCHLLPHLPPPNSKYNGDILANYRPGSVRALVCGEEASQGKFTMLKNICALLESALKNNLKSNNVRGTLIFILKEVLPEMLQWRYANVSERVDVVEATFSILHHSLHEQRIENELKELVILELSSSLGGAGATLRRVLEGGAYLETTLDQPAEWPHSSHANKLTRMAQLALSVTHRLVCEYLKWTKLPGNGLNEFFLGGVVKPSALISISPGAWVSPRPPHLALTIAQFVHHRLNPRLPYLAIKTLSSLSKELGIPLVACFGSEAEGLRDRLLTRLDSSTEDLWVKVAILRLLTASTRHQPGLIRLFLSPPETLLDSVIGILQTHKEAKNEVSKELLTAATELSGYLWEGNFALATSHLKKQEAFWNSLSFCLSKDPETVCDALKGNIFKIFSLELFLSKDCELLLRAIKNFVDPKSTNFSSWFKFIFVTLIENQINIMEMDETRDHANLLLKNTTYFISVLLSQSVVVLTNDQQAFLGEKIVEGLLLLFENGTETTRDLSQQLSEIHFTVIKECGKNVVANRTYRKSVSSLLGNLRSCVIQTKASCQIQILAAILKVITTTSDVKIKNDLAMDIVSDAVVLVEQHCALATSSQKNSADHFDCFNISVFTLSNSLLHQIMLCLSESEIQSVLEKSPVVYSLIHAACEYTKIGNSFVVCEILSLLSLFARQSHCSNELTTNNLSLTISLVLSSTSKNVDILCDLIWCTVWCLKREGSSGVEGASNVAAVHLNYLTDALCCSDAKPNLALAASTLALNLVPFHQLWRVSHSDCFEQLLMSTAACVHHTTKMLPLKETLERESTGDIDSSKCKPQESTIILINQLLQILCSSLQTIRMLTPDIEVLICCPWKEFNTWGVNLIQPTLRKLSADNIPTLPNLATLAEIIDLYHNILPKSSKDSKLSSEIDVPKLNQCMEEALSLLIIHTALIVNDSAMQPREIRDVRTFLIDETSSFFNQWLGRKSVASPLPPGNKTEMSFLNIPYLVLCRQIITSICNIKKV